MGWQWICRPDDSVGVYAAIDQVGNIAVLVKKNVDMALDFLVVGSVGLLEFQLARRKD